MSTTMRNVLLVAGALAIFALGGEGGYYLGSRNATVAGNATTPPRLAAQQPQAPTTAPAPVRGLPPGYSVMPPRTFGHWVEHCIKNDQDAKKCELLLRVVDSASKRGVVSLVLSRDPKGRAIFLVMVPPSVVLPAGLRLTLGSKPEARLNFLSCTPGACQAVLLLDKNLHGILTSADVARVIYLAGNGSEANYKFPTSGFDAGIAAWRKDFPAPPGTPELAETPKPVAPTPAPPAASK